MRKLLSIIVLLWSLSCFAALPPGVVGKKIPDYANLALPPGTYMFLISDPGGNYFNLTLAQLLAMGTNSGTLIVTNVSFQFLTNNYAYIANLINNYSTNTSIVTTNITIEVPGGATNLNLTPSSLMWSDANDAEASIPNATGVLTNNGSGAIGFSLFLQLTEIDAQNFFPINLFTGLTNYSQLGTDGNGLLALGSSTSTNLVVTNLVSITETNNTFVNTNVMILQSNATFTVKKGATLVIETNAFLVDSNITASSAVITDAKQNLTNSANAHGVYTNTASGPPSFGLLQNTELVNSTITIQGSSVALGGSTLAAGSSPSFNAINFTNSGYSLPTNNVGGGAFVFGGPGTPSTLYDTNITAATTLKLFDITACGATAGGFKLYVTCSGGTDRVLTFPNGCTGAGLGTPPAVTITNAKAAFFDVIYKPGATPVTNVFLSPVY